MCVNSHNHFYVCERCKTPLDTHNGSFYKGAILCDRCRSIAQIEDEYGRFDFTGAGMPSPGV